MEKQEISKIKVGETTYDIKDEWVRKALFGDDYQKEQKQADDQPKEKK